MLLRRKIQPEFLDYYTHALKNGYHSRRLSGLSFTQNIFAALCDNRYESKYDDYVPYIEFDIIGKVKDAH